MGSLWWCIQTLYTTCCIQSITKLSSIQRNNINGSNWETKKHTHTHTQPYHIKIKTRHCQMVMQFTCAYLLRWCKWLFVLWIEMSFTFRYIHLHAYISKSYCMCELTALDTHTHTHPDTQTHQYKYLLCLTSLQNTWIAFRMHKTLTIQAHSTLTFYFPPFVVHLCLSSALILLLPATITTSALSHFNAHSNASLHRIASQLPSMQFHWHINFQVACTVRINLHCISIIHTASTKFTM